MRRPVGNSSQLRMLDFEDIKRYQGFRGQSFGVKSSKSWYGTRIVKTRPSCMVGVVEHQKTCFCVCNGLIYALIISLESISGDFIDNWIGLPTSVSHPTLTRG